MADHLELLHEAPDGPALDLPDGLARRYPGRFGFSGPRVVANFVSSLDGVVAIPGLARANRLIADENDDDRFVMGLLRAAADVVLIGSGTLQASPKGLWTPASTYPDAADDWAELRRRLGRPPEPALAVITGTGGVDPNHPAFERGALVLTTDAGAQALSGLLPATSEVVALGDGPLVDVRRAVEEVRGRGHELVVLEAGPHVVGSMLGEELVDELFLTVSPLVAGRQEGQTRLGFVAGRELLPDVQVAGDLAGVRRSGDHLFLHYVLSAAAAT
jgi:riboflavin biosynthesis pyrimidine reductase